MRLRKPLKSATCIRTSLTACSCGKVASSSAQEVSEAIVRMQAHRDVTRLARGIDPVADLHARERHAQRLRGVVDRDAERIGQAGPLQKRIIGGVFAVLLGFFGFGYKLLQCPKLLLVNIQVLGHFLNFALLLRIQFPIGFGKSHYIGYKRKA